jgi:precorrin-6B methylase 2
MFLKRPMRKKNERFFCDLRSDRDASRRMISAQLFNDHRVMMADDRRVGALERAILEIVQPGDIVVDLGSGTGLLSMFALRAGAKRIYAIEGSDIFALAGDVFAANGVRSQTELIHARSECVALPEKADVLIGYVGFDEGLLSSFVDARHRFLKPSARMIPQRIQVVAVPITADADYERLVQFWSRDRNGFDYSRLRQYASQQRYAIELNESQLLGQPVPIFDIDLETVSDLFVKGEARFFIEESSIMHGLGTWCRIQLGPEQWLGFPPGRTPSWNHIFFPLREAQRVQPGDQIDVTLTTRNASIWRWQMAVNRRGEVVASWDESTFAGFPLHVGELHGRPSDALHRLTPLGRAALHSLGSMRGAGPDEVAVELALRFRQVLPTVGAARAFLSEMACCSGVGEKADCRSEGGRPDPPDA